MKATISGKSASGREPSVGIFWLLPHNRLILDLTPVSQAEPYGDALTHPRAHIAYWNALQQSGEVLPDVEYETHARGRVSFFPLEDRFGFFADPCILSKPGIVRRLIKAMRLPAGKTELLSDSHYRCARCLGARANQHEL